MKRIFGILFTLVVVLSMLAAPVAAQEGIIDLEPETPLPVVEGGAMVNESSSLWFVELSSQPAIEGTSLATLKAEKAAFRKEAGRAGLKYSERYAFNTLWNGFSIKMEAGQLSKLSRIAGVKNIYPVETISLPETTVSDPALFTALDMSGAAAAQSELGYTGAGIKVAVMDTGIDVDHPAFGGDGVVRHDSTLFPSARIPVGYDFVGDAFNADSTSPLYNPVTVPDNNPDDCGGHGTHVAGIVGADDATNGMKGVAPGVTFGAYRVFGCEGSTTADIMVAAMERALADDMDVLNMSIGSAYQWPQYPTAVAASRLVNKGMVVVASIGNNGPNGQYAAGAPGLGEKVIGVASYDNTIVTQSAFSLSPDGKLVGFNLATGAPPPPTSGSLPLAAPTPVNACPVLDGAGHYVSPFSAGSLTGQAVLVDRGVCSFYWKARFAQEAGAAAVLIANNVAGTLNPTVDPSGGAAFTPITCPHADFPTCPAITVPTVAILQADGATIRTRLAAGPVTLTWTDQTISAPNSTGGLISSFSSYGLSPDLALKPDIGAPGGSIWSSYPLEKGRYASLGGTSMSSPHVAGAVALLLQAHPHTPAQAVRDILQNSADPQNWWGAPSLGFLDMVHRQGAGMLDIDDAILATTRITPGKLALGESEAGPATRTLTIENEGSAAVTYDLSHVSALAGNPNTFSQNASYAPAAVAFSASSVTVPAGGTVTVDVTITANPGLANLAQYGGYIVFTPQGGGQVYRVPYAGLKGDYQAKQALTPTANGFPWLAVLYDGSFYKVTDPTDWTYTMQNGDVPFFLVHFDHQVRTFRVEIFAKNGKAWHRAYNEEYMGRNSSATGFFAFDFVGTTLSGNKLFTVPDGEYYAVITALKANGDPSNPAHWETWTSPNFVIDRP